GGPPANAIDDPPISDPAGGGTCQSSSGCTKLLAPVRIELAQPAHPFADRRMRVEERSEALLGERVGRVDRLGRGARLEADELHRRLEPHERIRESVR